LSHHATQHGDRIVTIDCCEITSPYVGYAVFSRHASLELRSE